MYYRNCPKCGKELSYKRKNVLKKAILKNTNCAECAKPKDFKHSNETLRIISEKCKGYKHSQEALIKISNASKGKNNPMYGKPSPQGSGNGWSGWYKGIYFRSLLYSSFMSSIDNLFISFSVKILNLSPQIFFAASNLSLFCFEFISLAGFTSINSCESIK